MLNIFRRKKKMRRCPECGKIVEYLHKYIFHEYKFEFTSKKEEVIFLESNMDRKASFECPHCGERLFDNEDDADNFMSREEI